ncbi:hypothetical protein CO704_23585 [Cedecea neteri]|uniref:Uncharacterized protein n=1 Tax=Cedecea neteri TaxID=158822 RepID=A0A291E5K1_9ENTR|nr:hypothetical protein CO704_23585 [Cedecea neteri]
MYFFCAASLPIARGLHNLVVPLSFRCLYSFISPPCYLRGGALTSLCSLKNGSISAAGRGGAASLNKIAVQQA